jgi:hypothetical protein
MFEEVMIFHGRNALTGDVNFQSSTKTFDSLIFTAAAITDVLQRAVIDK